MRTTLKIDDDVLGAAREIGRRERKTAGAIISDLARRALLQPVVAEGRKVREPRTRYGFAPLHARGAIVTDDLVRRLREEKGPE